MYPSLTSYLFVSRVNWWENLPEELLSTILGTLDVRPLCTARLVCGRFRQSSLTHVKALRLDCETLQQHPTSNFTQFTGLTHLKVTINRTGRLHLLAHPRIAPLITHIHIPGHRDVEVPGAEELPHLNSLLKLRTLDFWGYRHQAQDLQAWLEELRVGNSMNLSNLTHLSQLTRIKMIAGRQEAEALGSLTGLRNLCCLDLRTETTALEVLSHLSRLTKLSLDALNIINYPLMFRDLAQLTGLCDLG
jgi:hypothetical protein